MIMISRGHFAWCFLPLIWGSGFVLAGEWGDLRGRFVFGGDPPARKAIAITNDQEYCGKCDLYEENLVVDPTTKGVTNVVVWLHTSRGTTKPQIHESYGKTATDVVSLDSAKCRIDPHVRLLRTTQTLLVRNTDPIRDGLKIDSFSNASINILLPPKGEKCTSFAKPEPLPVRVGCSLHPWESGWLLVKEHPYMAVSDREGRFEIRNLPCGTWTFQFWHETAGYIRETRVAGKRVNWKRGRAEITISPGTKDLGDMELAAALFHE